MHLILSLKYDCWHWGAYMHYAIQVLSWLGSLFHTRQDWLMTSYLLRSKFNTSVFIGKWIIFCTLESMVLNWELNFVNDAFITLASPNFPSQGTVKWIYGLIWIHCDAIVGHLKFNVRHNLLEIMCFIE